MRRCLEGVANSHRLLSLVSSCNDFAIRSGTKEEFQRR